MSIKNNAICLENVHKVFQPHSVKVLEAVSFNIPKASCTIITGANGSGKSVLMNIIAGLTEPTSGTVNVEGTIGLVFQDADTQILGETPEEDVLYGIKNIKIPKKEWHSRCNWALQQTNLFEKKHNPARFLSGGEKRRLAVSAILAMDCSIIIFDEPYANLDYFGVCQVNELLIMLQKQKKTIVLLTHELEKCLALGNYFVLLYQGQVVFKGLPKEALELNLSQYGVKNPLCSYTAIDDLLWIAPQSKAYE